MRVLLLVASLALAADPAELELVDHFLSTPTSELDPEEIDDFMLIDSKSLPARQRQGYIDKRFELYVKRHIARSLKKGFVRVPAKDCKPPEEAKSNDIAMLKRTGFDELTEEELRYVRKKSKCTEKELLCESTLQLVPPKKAKEDRRVFLSVSDPLFAFAIERRRSVGGQSDFFGGKGGALCSR